jgi:amidophosphoribosyltransferase
MSEELKEECGVAAVIGDAQAAHFVFLSLYALQHRGQEACGIVARGQLGGEIKFHDHRAYGLVGDAFNKEILQTLVGDTAVGHVRYSTHGGQMMQNVQPFSFSIPRHGRLVIATNGNFTNADELRERLEESGSIFTSTSDTEVFVHLLAKSKKEAVLDRIFDVCDEIRGAYSMALLAEDTLYAIRDPYGFRPLVIGRKNNAYVVVSETCALDLIGATFEREVDPGEVVALVPGQEPRSHRMRRDSPKRFCSFEPIYFARPDSRIFGREIYNLRKRMGQVLADEHPTKADVVVAIPDSGVPMALGYSEISKIPLELGLIRNHYVGRTFIEPEQGLRDFGVKLKFNAVCSSLNGKSLIVIDDSIVRGTSSLKIIRMLRAAGAKEIHFRVGSPPYTHSCFYGVDTPDREKLLAAYKSTQQMCEFIGADTLAFLSPQGLKQALGENASDFCYACFDGKYPEEIFTEVAQQPTDLTGGPGYFAARVNPL